jgi:formate dehydrogenase subunit gamma
VRQREEIIPGTTQVRGVETGILINARGDEWSRFRDDVIKPYGLYILLGIIAVITLFYMVRGKVNIEGGLSGDMVHRFDPFERTMHWVMAVVFLFLALTGLILLLGRPLLIPIMGKEVFSILASSSKEGHNLMGPLFAVSVVLMFFRFVKRNIYAKGDLTWLLKGGGFIGKGHVTGGFFNMGEKTWYWIFILIGAAVSVSGLILVSPNFGQGRVIMEWSHIAHSTGAIVLMAVAIGHMYLGSFGTEGSFEAMKTGYVDIKWAEAHHDRWAERCHKKGLIVPSEEYLRSQGKGVPSLDKAPYGAEVRK